MSQESYLSTFAISNSSLKDWGKVSPQKWNETWITKKRKRPQSKAVILGSLVDVLAFQPDELEKRYVLAGATPPSDKVELILKAVIEHYHTLNQAAASLSSKGKKAPKIKEAELDLNLLETLCVKFDHYAKNPATGANDVVKKGKDYFEFLKTAQNRTVYTQDQLDDAKKIVDILRTNPICSPFFIAKKNVTLLHQVKIFTEFEVSGVDGIDHLPIKGAVDTLHINNKRKEIREVDLKVTEDAFLFQEMIRLFGYVDQHSFYDNLINQWKLTYDNGIYKDYTVCPPLNVVIDNDLKIPYIYQYNATDLHVSRYGIENTKIKGWEEKIHEIAFHMAEANWSHPKSHILNGFIPVNYFNRK